MQNTMSYNCIVIFYQVLLVNQYDIALADYTKGFSITHFLTLIHVKDYRLNTLLFITNMIN